MKWSLLQCTTIINYHLWILLTWKHSGVPDTKTSLRDPRAGRQCPQWQSNCPKAQCRLYRCFSQTGRGIPSMIFSKYGIQYDYQHIVVLISSYHHPSAPMISLSPVPNKKAFNLILPYSFFLKTLYQSTPLPLGAAFTPLHSRNRKLWGCC